MCGIAGWVDWERNLAEEKAILSAMGNTLVCRGPDAGETWLTKSAAFAHRRLIVVDPAGGAQPMTRTAAEHAYTVTYNGELYNTDAIRAELVARGHSFQSYSDTEVLLISYIEWGPACVERFNGIFAFAIWDDARQTLFLARDRLGVKPLFYARKGSAFMFGSELKALLAHPLLEPVVDAQGLAEVFAMGPARTPGLGVFKDIMELRAGHYLLATKDGNHLSQYWQLQSEAHPDNIGTTIETVRNLLVDTVERQLVSDVPICTFLSGGLDSSAVSAIAAKWFGRQGMDPLHTYSVEFADMEQYFQANSFQTGLDSPWAKRISEFLGTVHHPVVLDTKDLLIDLMAPLRSRDLPGMADIDNSLYMFCREIKKRATVALSGESADEVFGGYPWFHRQDALEAATFPWSMQMQARVDILSPELRELIRPEEYVADRYQEALAQVPRLPGENARDARIREISYLSITRFLPTLLDRKDRMSMASGLEVRVPFCDHRLVQYVFNIPWDMKTYGGQTKGILREAMQGYLPADALARKKSPYPSTPHPVYLEAVRAQILAILDDPEAPLNRLVDKNAIKQMAAASFQPTVHRPWFGQIMATAQMFHYLIETNTWLRDFHIRTEL